MRRPTQALLFVALLGGCNLLESPVANIDPHALDELLNSSIVRDLDQEPDYPWRYEQAPEAALAVEPRPTVGGDDLVNIELRGVPLGEALHMLAEHVGANFVLDADLTAPVSASFPSVRVDDALSILLAQNGLSLQQEPGGIYWVRRADGSAAELATFQLRSVNAADVVENLTGLLGAGVTVVADTNQNVILVNGTEASAVIAAEYLRYADRLKPQVLLEVRIFEATLSDDFEFGITQSFDGSIDDNAWSVLEALSTPGSNFSTTFTSRDGDIGVTLEALRDHIGLELISAPRVMAVTNTQAIVSIVEDVPYVETTSSIDTGSSSTTQTQVSFKEAGIKLTVTPTIQDMGILQIDIDQELSEVVGSFLEIPIVDIRKFVTRFLVADRQTCVLGGLMQSERRDVDRGVPLLMDIPGLGRFFRSDQDSTMRRELLVFVTPRILDPNEAAKMAKQYQTEYRQRTSAMAEVLDDRWGGSEASDQASHDANEGAEGAGDE